ncbi:aminotransferase class I/II-fold pyridoxal phosphate-dependent enzyme [Allorhizobium sp. BGMRC 0089]|uniref:DegT/DnrJ/EryC1/StrS family aminotransferase n=1 Tax=Allorhizobium sonneratiae TaxID=2934936 RepID=UPI00203349FB|nr:aminotransferase class I/II-fold pyridoxal phosphate-dependent enzyme [Allorhizobium sonneratiae]MCM2292396.1 aminotransferase class I/II-fold pyridoxal phosphate-dependent enzyme [Allorhizobium sonneratiae]
MMPSLEQSFQEIDESDIERVVKQLRTGQINVVSGGILARFERDFAKFAGAAHAIAMNSGTSAIYAALRAVGVEPGDEVIVPDYGFHGMAAAVLATGAKVKVCDVEPSGLTLSPEALQQALSPEVRAVLVHHPWGVPADLQALRAVTDLPIISDASHAHGALLRGKPLAAYADITCFSLGLGKLISGGELGCAVTDHAHLHEAMMIDGHVNRVPHDLKVGNWRGNAIGLKLRPHALALTLGSGQLKRFAEKQLLLSEAAAALEQAGEACGLGLQRAPADGQRAWYQVRFRVKDASARADVVKALQNEGLPARIDDYDPTLQGQSIFTWPGHAGKLIDNACPVATQEASHGILIKTPAGLETSMLQSLPQRFQNAISAMTR